MTTPTTAITTIIDTASAAAAITLASSDVTSVLPYLPLTLLLFRLVFFSYFLTTCITLNSSCASTRTTCSTTLREPPFH